MGAVRRIWFAVALVVGCGGRTTGTDLNASSATSDVGGSGIGTGTSSGEAVGTSGRDAGLWCEGPYCVWQCPTEQTMCRIGLCFDLQTDPHNCGACDRMCAFDESCQAGSCVPTVDAGSRGMETVADVDGSCGPCPDADITSPPSCAPGGPGMTNCGSGGMGTESCCTSFEVTGDAVTVSGFRLDEYEVTVGRFRQFVGALNGGWLPQAGSGKHTYLNGGRGLVDDSPDADITYEPGWLASDDVWLSPTSQPPVLEANDSTWTASAGSNENLPINYVTWWKAYAFCIWDGGFLPSAAEWGYAATGGAQGLEYPWGSTDPGTMNQFAIYACYYSGNPATCLGGAAVSNLAPVGTAAAGAGLWGQVDLAGNVDEWNLDWWDVVTTGCADCAAVAPGAPQPNPNISPNRVERVTRGGDFRDSYASALLPTIRRDVTPGSLGDTLGFRCARTP
jgi:formylglycine-generating enzyme